MPEQRDLACCSVELGHPCYAHGVGDWRKDACAALTSRVDDSAQITPAMRVRPSEWQQTPSSPHVVAEVVLRAYGAAVAIHKAMMEPRCHTHPCCSAVDRAPPPQTCLGGRTEISGVGAKSRNLEPPRSEELGGSAAAACGGVVHLVWLCLPSALPPACGGIVSLVWMCLPSSLAGCAVPWLVGSLRYCVLCRFVACSHCVMPSHGRLLIRLPVCCRLATGVTAAVVLLDETKKN